MFACPSLALTVVFATATSPTESHRVDLAVRVCML